MDCLQTTFSIIRRPGPRHSNADGPSRSLIPCSQCQLTPDCYAQFDTTLNRQNAAVPDQVRSTRLDAATQPDLATLQQQDAAIASIIHAMQMSSTATEWESFHRHSDDTENLLAQWPQPKLVNNILYRRWTRPDQLLTVLQGVISHALRRTMLYEIHAGFAGGHFGIKKTAQQLQRRAYRKGWRENCKKIIASCPQCATYRRGKAPRQ
jgi:hypothetical protein